MAYPKDFESIAIFKSNIKEPKFYKFKPKLLNERDIDIRIECCGVCGSDVHAATGDWGPLKGPLVPGHEIVGKVVQIGKSVTSVIIGDRVGVSAQVLSCFKCNDCKDGNYGYCPKMVLTYDSPYEDGYISKGGYASHIRVHEHFSFKIPETLPSEVAAPFLCGGITAFSPLVRYKIGPGKKIGICGIGGIGHFAILLAKALGAEVYAISRSDVKREDSLKLGADHYISSKEKDWTRHYIKELDLLLLCGSSLSGINIDEYMEILKARGAIHSICGPPAGEKLTIDTFRFLFSGVTLSTSLTGTHEEINTMLKLVADKDVKPWIERIPMSEEGVSEALQRAKNNDVRFRFVLTDYDKVFKVK